jgi:NAD(P)H-hydrate epimerase
VVADITLTVGVAKQGLVADEATNHVGRIEWIPLEDLPVPPDGDRLIVPGELARWLPPRRFDFHKGDAGRVGIVAGSRGLLGASVLTALGALRGGAGLVSLFVPEDLYALAVSQAPPPELMIRPVASYGEVREHPLAALAIGPGLGRPGKKQRGELMGLLAAFAGPVVLDADGLNMVAEAGLAGTLEESVLVTPHPGEMERLMPGSADLPRAELARQFAMRPVTRAWPPAAKGMS